MANGGSANIANSNKFNKYEDTDSGTGSSSSEAHVIRHIDRNILACQICQHRYKEPKVFKCSKVPNKRTCTKIASNGLKNGLNSLKIDLK